MVPPIMDLPRLLPFRIIGSGLFIIRQIVVHCDLSGFQPCQQATDWSRRYLRGDLALVSGKAHHLDFLARLNGIARMNRDTPSRSAEVVLKEVFVYLSLLTDDTHSLHSSLVINFPCIFPISMLRLAHQRAPVLLLSAAAAVTWA